MMLESTLLSEKAPPCGHLDGFAGVNDAGTVRVEPEAEGHIRPKLNFTLAVEGEDTGLGLLEGNLIAGSQQPDLGHWDEAEEAGGNGR
jgi:hypothetical protein